MALIKKDDQLVEWFDQKYIPWFRVPAFQRAKQSLSERMAVDINSPKLKHLDILEHLLADFLHDRIRVAGLSAKLLRREHLSTLNEGWKLALKDRIESDPLGELKRPSYPLWLARKTWSYDEFLALVLRIEPRMLDADTIELAVPYSVIGQRATKIMRKLDYAVEANEIRFPDRPTKLLSWAMQNGIALPEQVSLALRNAKKVTSTHTPAVALLTSMRQLIEGASERHSLRLVQTHLIAVVEEALEAQTLNQSAFKREIWKKLPSRMKESGKPTDDWWKRWKPARTDILKKLKEQVRAATSRSRSRSK